MAIFVVCRVSNGPAVEGALKAAFPDDHLKIADKEWLISSSATPKDVSDRLGISDGKNGSGIVFTTGGYFGRATTEVWDWIKAKAESA